MNGPHLGHVLAMHSLSDNGDTLLVGIRSGHHAFDTSLYRTEDGGDSWSRVLGPAAPCFTRMNIVNLNDDSLFVSCTWDQDAPNQGSVFYQSDNKGLDWEEIGNSHLYINDISVFGGAVIAATSDGIYQIDVDTSRVIALNSMYTTDLEHGPRGTLLVAGRGGLHALNKTDSTWQVEILSEIWSSRVKMSSAGEIWLGGYDGLFYKKDFESDWSDNLTSEQVRALEHFDEDGSVYLSDDQGLHVFKNGERRDYNLPIVTSEILVINSQVLLLGGNEGVYRMDLGDMESRHVGVPATHILSIEVDSQDKLYVGTNYWGLWTFTDQHGWEFVFPLHARQLLLDSKGSLFALSSYDNVFRSSDSGKTWQEIEFDDQIVRIDESPDGVLIAISEDGERIYSSDDHGDTFVAREVEAPQWALFHGLVSFNGGLLYATTGGDIYELSENDTWENLNSPSGYVVNLQMKMNGDLFAYGYDGIFVFSQNSREWTKIRNGTIESMDYNGENIFVGIRNEGISWSNNDGASWESLEGDLPNDYGNGPSISAIAKNSRGVLYIGSRLDGVLKSRIPIFVADLDQQDLSNSFNYPNPFSEKTNIVFELDDVDEVQLKVFNLAGQELLSQQLVNPSSGTNQIDFDGTGLPSSVYVYQISSDDKVVRGVMHLRK